MRSGAVNQRALRRYKRPRTEWWARNRATYVRYGEYVEPPSEMERQTSPLIYSSKHVRTVAGEWGALDTYEVTFHT
jgi:hypothetical protein